MNNLEQCNNSNSAEQVPYSAIQHSVDTINLTSSEVGQLWSTYMAQSMSKCMAQSMSKCMVPFFVEKCKDPDIRSLLQFVLDVSNRHVNSITEIFNKSNIPIPMASLMRTLM